MSVYADASVLVSLFIQDSHADRARTFLRTGPVLVVSDFAAAEFASALNRRVRMGELLPDQARSAFLLLDTWRLRDTQIAQTNHMDVLRAEALLRQLDFLLRTPDALNIAIAERMGAALATFDDRMADSARRLGVALVDL